jgi:uncharacterized protein (DUF1330 family)
MIIKNLNYKILFGGLIIFGLLLSCKTQKEEDMKAAYCLFENVEITNPNKMETYTNQVFEVVQKFGGEYSVLNDKIRYIEGEWKPSFLVLIKFPSLEHANRWYDSDEYKELKALRHSAGRFNAVIVQGV